MEKDPRDFLGSFFYIGVQAVLDVESNVSIYTYLFFMR